MILLASSLFLREDRKQRERMRPYSPLATLLVASALRERGHAVSFFDATLASGVEEFVDKLRETKPTVVGILEDNFNFLTKMCTVRTRELTLAMVSAAHGEGCLVAVNGSDASDHPEIYLRAGADAVLHGEADESFLALVDAWTVSPDAELSGVAGLVLQQADGDVVRTAPSRSVKDLNALPLPAWDLVDVESYREAWTDAHGRLSWNMISSRGCPYGCNWCAKPIFGRRYTQRSPENVANEIAQLREEIRQLRETLQRR